MRLVSVVADIRGHLADESHQSQASTYKAMRRLYVKSHGRSQLAWRLLFRTLRRPGRPGVDPLGLAAEVKANGYAVRPGFLDQGKVERLGHYFDTQQGQARGAIRLDYTQTTASQAPGVKELLEHPALLGAARNYLGAQPIFAGINAWRSLADPAATEADYSDAAQMFHFDCDWPRFIKFFIYLTDVGDQDGPFAIVEGTHRSKPIWRDGRFDEADLLDRHGLRSQERRLTGSAGTLIAADTSAFHRGTPVVAGPRLVLQLEFAVSRLGASAQYPSLPAALRPPGKGHTFDLFSA